MDLLKIWNSLSNTSHGHEVDDVYRSFMGEPYTHDSFIAMSSNLASYAKRRNVKRMGEAIVLAKLSGRLTKEFKSNLKKYRSRHDRSV